MLRAVATTGALLLLALPSSAAARPCSDKVPVIVAGVQWIVYTGDVDDFGHRQWRFLVGWHVAD